MNYSISLIKQFEGFIAVPYLCPAGVPTIGFGTTTYSNGNKVTLKDSPIDIKRGEFELRSHIDKNIIPTLDLLKLTLNENQLSAVISFCYNIGITNFKLSTLCKYLISKDYKKAAEEFDKWTLAKGKILPGLIKRRIAEKELFNKVD